MRLTKPSLNLRSIRSTALSRWLTIGLLAVALSVAQQHAVLHWLSHALTQAADPAKAASAGAQHCAECDAVASFGAGAPPPAGLALAPRQDRQVHGTSRDAVARGSLPWLAYRSRAPPTLV